MLRPGTRARGRGALVAAALLSVLAVVAVSAAGAQAGAAAKPVPVIYVHGHSGSAQQFETNAMRFTSNGYPHGRLFAYEWDTSADDNDAAVAGLDGYISEVLARTGASQVDVLAHSRGTTVMHTFLETPARAGLVRRYVNFDGRTAESEPGGVPTLAVWGEGDQSREIAGAENVYFPNRAHTEVTTSAAAFTNVYEFLTGSKPATKAVTAENPRRVKVAGRASLFPDNTGMEGRLLEVYELRRTSGARKPGGPEYSMALGADGSFGPLKVDGSKRYEFAVSMPGERTLHNYPEPFEHDDYFYRVLNAPELTPFIESGPDHTTVAVTRMREFWGDQARSDKLQINGLNVVTPETAPRERRVLAVFTFDKDSDGASDTGASLFPFNLLPFLTGVDNYAPASPDAGDRITVKATMRGKHVEKTNVPNWRSDEHTVSVFFKDYVAKEYSGRG